jgi:hypothetical protein
MITTIAKLEYDEKLARMALHSERIKTDKTFGHIEQVKNDFSVISTLKNYANNRIKREIDRRLL